MSKMTCADCPGGTDFEQRAADLQAQIEREQAYSRKLTSFIERNVSGGIHGNGLARSAPIGDEGVTG